MSIEEGTPSYLSSFVNYSDASLKNLQQREQQQQIASFKGKERSQEC